MHFSVPSAPVRPNGAARRVPGGDNPPGVQARLIWFVRLLPLMTYLTRLTSTCFTESRCRASHSTMGTSGPRLSAILMSSGSNRGAPSKQLMAIMNGSPLR